jgi:cellobiose-specific phosphotransferase system component IIC
MSDRDPHDWMAEEPPEYLPEFIRDFHDAKDFFKCLQETYKPSEDLAGHNWVSNQIFTVDYFLWFCGVHGYTLQKSRKKGIAFKDIRATIKASRDAKRAMFASAFASKPSPLNPNGEPQ